MLIMAQKLYYAMLQKLLLMLKGAKQATRPKMLRAKLWHNIGTVAHMPCRHRPN